MLKYISKFVLDILPSVAATIVGAYIVNHYIVPKSDPGKPVAETASTVNPAKAVTAKAPAETSADVAGAPDVSAVKAKAVDKAAKSTDTASAPTDSRRHQPAPREKAVAKAAPVVTPPVATASVAPASEAATTVEDRRDANDLARAAIERLRGAGETQPRPQEASRPVEPARTTEPSRVAAAPSIQPLPPAIMVTTPPAEGYSPAQGDRSLQPSYAPSEAAFDPRRPRPPGDIPQALPLDIQADATGALRRERTSVAEDVLAAAKSVFHSLPRPFEH